MSPKRKKKGVRRGLKPSPERLRAMHDDGYVTIKEAAGLVDAGTQLIYMHASGGRGRALVTPGGETKELVKKYLGNVWVLRSAVLATWPPKAEP